MGPVGFRQNLEDKTVEWKAEICIAKAVGPLNVKIEKSLLKDARAGNVWDECGGDGRGTPLFEPELMRRAREAQCKEGWEGGKVLDPENGRDYGLRVMPVEGGKKVEVIGAIGPLERTQTWSRIP